MEVKYWKTNTYKKERHDKSKSFQNLFSVMERRKGWTFFGVIFYSFLYLILQVYLICLQILLAISLSRIWIHSSYYLHWYHSGLGSNSFLHVHFNYLLTVLPGSALCLLELFTLPPAPPQKISEWPVYDFTHINHSTCIQGLSISLRIKAKALKIAKSPHTVSLLTVTQHPSLLKSSCPSLSLTYSVVASLVRCVPWSYQACSHCRTSLLANFSDFRNLLGSHPHFLESLLKCIFLSEPFLVNPTYNPDHFPFPPLHYLSFFFIFSIVPITTWNSLQPSLSIWEELIPEPPRVPKSTDAQVPYQEWHYSQPSVFVGSTSAVGWLEPSDTIYLSILSFIPSFFPPS